MYWEGNTWNRARDLDNWLASSDFSTLAKWGRKKSRAFVLNYGHKAYDKEVITKRNNKQILPYARVLGGTK